MILQWVPAFFLTLVPVLFYNREVLLLQHFFTSSRPFKKNCGGEEKIQNPIKKANVQVTNDRFECHT